MVHIYIRGVEVDFPFQPYQCQVNYMEKVLQCLQEGTNGVLESPTGTGKTLCLLCAALAWREAYIAQKQLASRTNTAQTDVQHTSTLQDQLNQAAGNTAQDDQETTTDIPQIIYTSRTHSQLTQAMKELKNTSYSPKVSVLGSREQMCIHPTVTKQETNVAKMHMCRAKVTTKSCHFYNNLEANRDDKDISNIKIVDIEDLINVGTKHSICPYYFAREKKSSADIVFMPYNYILDPKARQGQNIEITDSIILFDEAHNIERMCEESVSFDLTSFDIASCIEDLDTCLDLINTMEQEGSLTMSDDTEGVKIEKKDVVYIKGIFLKLEEELTVISTNAPKDGVTHPGIYIYELFGKVKISSESYEQILVLIDKCNDFLTSTSSTIRERQYALSIFADALKIVFNTPTNCSQESQTPSSNAQTKASKHYKVHIKATEGNSGQKELDVWSSSKAAKSGKGYSLGYWCFSPGDAMKDLARRKEVRTIILTSGTLSPIQSFKAELQIAIPVQLQNPHVIEDHQVCVTVVKSGPDGGRLKSTYRYRSKPEYLQSLGNCLVNFARVVPDGMLVFFTSYNVLDMSVKFWKEHKLWDRINKFKDTFVEPRNKAEFKEAMTGFYDKILEANTHGAAFFAVMRGKVSEGLDFADTNGRAVIITGLPYPPVYDTKVTLKMNFLDEVKNKRKFQGMAGSDWYAQQATRAVNQAVGRVLRHKDDYGAIILCDERFGYDDSISELPTWIQPHVKKYQDFGQAQRDLTHFFRNADKMCDKSRIKIKPRITEIDESGQTENKQSNRLPFVMNTTNTQQTASELDVSRETSHTRTRNVVHRDTPLSVQYSGQSEPRKEQTCENKSSGFFETLNAHENQEKVVPQPKEASCSTTSRPVVVTKEVARRPKKKIKIVGSKPFNQQTKENDTSEQESISSFVHKLKDILIDIDERKTFCGILANFKQSNDIVSVLQPLTDLFLSNKERHKLFLDFSCFVKDTTQKDFYLNHYEEITGQDIPDEYKKKRKSSNLAETSRKKSRN